MEEINILEAARTERDHQRELFKHAMAKVLRLGKLHEADKETIERINQAFADLGDRSHQKEKELEPLERIDSDEYLSQMIELCDSSAKEYAKLAGQMNSFWREIRLQRASKTIPVKDSNQPD